MYLVQAANLSRSAAQRLIREGNVQVNGATALKAGTEMRKGDRLSWTFPEPEHPMLCAEEMPLDIRYEDSDVCVLNKPQGMVVHPAPGHLTGTLVHGLMAHFTELPVIGGEFRPGIVHRIDKMTSGLLVIARNDAAHHALSEQFRDHTAERAYISIVDGNIREDVGVIAERIGRHPRDRKRMAVVENGRTALTRWKVLKRYGRYTLLALRLETGRTHQIRVHMASVGHPLSGDEVYGRRQNALGLKGQALHGYRLSFIHPVSGETMCFRTELPDYFQAALRRLDAAADASELLNCAEDSLFPC